MSDMFGENIEKREDRQSNSKFRKTEFLKLDEGEHTIRILDPREVKHYTHYMGWAYIRCLGDECPICQNNKKLMYEHPENFREMKGWNPRRDRYYINVLDRTKGRICGKCETENEENSSLCDACGSPLGESVPLDRVKVLSGSAKLFEDLKVLSNAVRNENDERVDIRTYDWTLLVRGKDRDKTTLVRDRYFPAKAGFIEVAPELLYDLEKAVIDLTAEEMLDVFNGTSLKDVFALRRAAKQVIDSADFMGTDSIKEDVKQAAESIFKH